MTTLPKIAAATAVLAFLTGTDANAASENFCNEYAGTSVEQFNRAQELGLTVAAPRWHGAFDLHKVWCRIVSKEAAQHEIDERRAVLDEGEPPADAGTTPPSDPAGEPPYSDAAEPPPSDAADPPLSAPVDEPASALSDGGPPLSAPADRPPSDTAETPSSDEGDPPSSGAGEPPPSEGGLLWEPAD